MTDPITPIDETLRALEDLGRRGPVRYIGLSNYQVWKAATMIQQQKDLNFQPFTVSQMHYSILNREVESKFIPMCLYHGMPKKVVSSVIIGVSEITQLEDNLKAAIELSEEIRGIDELTQPPVRYPATYIAMQDEQLTNTKRKRTSI